MEKSSKRGKIPQQDWPSIISRYEAGETLASIARTYDCSPPAISYIVSRTRARGAAAEAPTPSAVGPSEPQLVKAPAVPPTSGMAGTNSLHGSALTAAPEPVKGPVAEAVRIEPGAHAPEAGERRLFPDEPPAAPRIREAHWSPDSDQPGPPYGVGQRDTNLSGNGAAGGHPPGFAAAPPQTGEARRTLHLSLPNGNGSAAAEPRQHNAGGQHSPGGQPNAGGRNFESGGSSMPQGEPEFGHGARRNPPPPAMPQPSPLGAARAPLTASGDSPRTKENLAFIDQALRERIDGDIAAFLAAFDAALDHDTAESRTGLREATDRLLRAGARTRIELERLEARVPLGSRDRNAQAPLQFRQR